MTPFQEGYSFTSKFTGTLYSGLQAQGYITSINDEIQALSDNLNSFKGFNTGTAQLKGNAAEFWHAGTHNINSALEGSDIRATVLESNGFGSVDVHTSDGLDFGLKYYSSGADSANSQAVSYWQAYNEYIASMKRQGLEYPTINEYLSARNVPSNVLLSDPIYLEQIRVIPADQLEKAREALEKKIAKLMETRPDEVFRYQDTLDKLTDRIENSEGIESIPLSEEEAKNLASLAKEGAFDPDDYDLNTEALVEARHILDQALQAGLTAALITMVLKTAPEIFKSIDILIKGGQIDNEDFKRLGFAAATGASEGFLRGSIAASITAAGQAGLLGEAFKAVKPEVIGALTVITLETIKNAYLVANGKMTTGEMTDNLVRSVYVSSGALVLGGIGQSLLPSLPLVGYLIGSFVGSVVGGFAYTASYKTYISLAIENGYTYFGLVDQNYELPKEVLDSLGLELFKYEEFLAQNFEAFKFETISFEATAYAPTTIEMVTVRRGVIGVNSIGYRA
ncbi:MAG: hypothetical protein IBX55_21675 [Methyloprofundus sp.]|nr:hypothetical protein [Methyloprofundus sp.]